MEPVEDSPSARKCLTATAGAAQWRCTRSCLSLITRHFLTVSLMYCLFAAFFTSKTAMYNNTFIYVSVHFIFDLFNELLLTISSFGLFYFGLSLANKTQGPSVLINRARCAWPVNRLQMGFRLPRPSVQSVGLQRRKRREPGN